MPFKSFRINCVWVFNASTLSWSAGWHQDDIFIKIPCCQFVELLLLLLNCEWNGYFEKANEWNFEREKGGGHFSSRFHGRVCTMYKHTCCLLLVGIQFDTKFGWHKMYLHCIVTDTMILILLIALRSKQIKYLHLIKLYG